MEILSKARLKYKHFKEHERFKLEVLVAQEVSVSEISKLLNKRRSSVYREIKRGKVKLLQSDLSEKEQYRADVAQADYRKKTSQRERPLKIGKDKALEDYIRKRIKENRYSPDAVIGEIKKKGYKFEGMLCTKTLYNYIERGLFHDISLKDLWEKRKYKKRGYKQGRISVRNRTGSSIDERCEALNERQEYGHWEGDCVKGPQGQGTASLFTLTERMTREEKIMKIETASQEQIKQCMDRLEQQYGAEFSQKFKSVTLDNGGEFLDWQAIETSICQNSKKRIKVYFAHPYSSWERGSNENHNRMIRRFIPKGKDISKVSVAEVQDVENWMNNYPRKILGYQSPNELVSQIYTARNV